MISSRSIDKCAEVIDDHWRTYFCAPTIRHIGAVAGLRSTSTVTRLIDCLVEERGYIRTPAKAASIVPPWVREAIRTASPKQENHPGENSVTEG